MKKTILFAGAVALGTVAAANPSATADTEVEVKAETSAETQVYDGPDSYTPSQPPPADYTGMGGPDGDNILAQRLDTYQPIVRDEYPICSATITDNCKQRIDPGY